MKKKLVMYEIDIDYACVINNRKIVSLLSFIDNDTLQFLLREKESVFYDENNRIRVIPNINKVNQKIELELENSRMPRSLLFTYDKDDINEEYIYIKEVFSGVSIKVDKILVSFFKINRLKANYKLFKYDLEQINNVKKIMLNAEKETFNPKIIDFPIKRIKER